MTWYQKNKEAEPFYPLRHTHGHIGLKKTNFSWTLLPCISAKIEWFKFIINGQKPILYTFHAIEMRTREKRRQHMQEGNKRSIVNLLYCKVPKLPLNLDHEQINGPLAFHMMIILLYFPSKIFFLLVIHLFHSI